MSIILECDRIDCGETVDTMDASMGRGAGGETIDVFVGESSEAEGWRVEYVGMDRVLHCPDHADTGGA